MLRFASRFLGFWLLAAAVVAGVVDGAKCIAASALVTTSLGEAWSLVAGLGGGEAHDTAATAPPSLPALLEIPLHWLSALPAVAVLGIAGAVFLFLGAKRRPPSLSREFAA